MDKIEEVIGKLPPEVLEEIKHNLRIDMLRDVQDIIHVRLGELFGNSIAESLNTVIPHLRDLITQECGFSKAVEGLVDELEKRTRDTKEDLLLKALTLYEAALDAKDKGERLVILGRDYKFVREITGAGRTEGSMSEPVAR